MSVLTHATMPRHPVATAELCGAVYTDFNGLEVICALPPGHDELPPNLRDMPLEEAVAWKSFGLHVLTLCDTPFAEWSVSDVPGLGVAGAQVRNLAERHGVHR